MEFTKDMIGREVIETSTGDCGVITKQYVPEFDIYGEEVRVYVRWSTGSEAGQTLHIALDSVSFAPAEPIAATSAADVIVEIAGIKYKLVRV